jgi:hypothetical protein
VPGVIDYSKLIMYDILHVSALIKVNYTSVSIILIFSKDVHIFTLKFKRKHRFQIVLDFISSKWCIKGPLNVLMFV